MLVSKVKPAETRGSGWANSPFTPPALMRGDKEPMSKQFAKMFKTHSLDSKASENKQVKTLMDEGLFCKREVCKEGIAALLVAQGEREVWHCHVTSERPSRGCETSRNFSLGEKSTVRGSESFQTVGHSTAGTRE